MSRIDVVGLGPAGPELLTAETLALVEGADASFLRTTHHPAAEGLAHDGTFDHHYQVHDDFEAVYAAIVEDLVEAARSGRRVVYAVPGSPTVAERTVVLLREHPAVTDGRVELVVHPSVSFVDLACARLGIDPVSDGARIVDAAGFAINAAGDRGPLLVAQCWNRSLLSEVKLSIDPPPDRQVTLLHHLGLTDEVVVEVPWDDLDRALEPDHLTSLWIPRLDEPVAGELVALCELVRTLREQCPWDRVQTHGSLARHLLEESYEVLEAIDVLAAIDAGQSTEAEAGAEEGAEARAVTDLEEELGDLLFQVAFHSVLATEAGRFTLADVARSVREKLVSRHPHVFGDVTADTAEQVATNWEALKREEKGRTHITEGIPAAMPALALTAKLQRKALAVGIELPSSLDEVHRLGDVGATVAPAEPNGAALRAEHRAELEDDEIGDLLFSLVNLARMVGVDPEAALRVRARRFREEIDRHG